MSACGTCGHPTHEAGACKSQYAVDDGHGGPWWKWCACGRDEAERALLHAVRAKEARREKDRVLQERRQPENVLDGLLHLTDEQRLDLFSKFCRGCGREQGKVACTCMRDE